LKKPLIFVGSRSVILEMAHTADLNNIEILGILDSQYYGNTEEIQGIPVIGSELWLLDKDNSQAKKWLKDCDFLPVNWHNGSTEKENNLGLLRQQRINILKESNANLINLIHPDTSIPKKTKYSSFSIGIGNYIHPGVYISSNNVQIGNYCIISSTSSIHHDVTIHDNVLVGPNVHLDICEIGTNSLIGSHSRTNPVKKKGSIKIGENVTVWTGSEVIKDIPKNCHYTFDNRILRKN
jgi:UDP-3-O-[3-hydroxymyristoyl] glucosamine N-acyltransferase